MKMMKMEEEEERVRLDLPLVSQPSRSPEAHSDGKTATCAGLRLFLTEYSALKQSATFRTRPSVPGEVGSLSPAQVTFISITFVLFHLQLIKVCFPTAKFH